MLKMKSFWRFYTLLLIFTLLKRNVRAVDDSEDTTTSTTTDDSTSTSTSTTSSASSSSSSSSSDDSVLGFSTSSSTSSNSTKGASKYLKTNSLLTCMEESQFSSTFFDVTYFPHNKSIYFNIEAVTTISSKVEIEADVIIYGLNVIQKTIKLCSLNEKSLCPLSAGRFDVSSTYSISSDVVNQIPGVSYTVPNLDAIVRVYAYPVDDDGSRTSSTPVACVMASLTNGKTVQTKYAAWPIAAISGLGVLTSAYYSVMGHSATSAHVASNAISLFVYFQNLSITAMMGVFKVPPIASAWCQNFEWSMGIIHVKFMQDILKWYVQSTGGTSTNILNNRSILSIYVQKFKSKLKSKLKKRAILLSSAVSSSIFEDKNLYTTDERNITAVASKTLLVRGIERVAFKADIELSNFFLTGIVFTLFFIFCLLVAFFSLKSLLELMVRTGTMNPENTKFFEFRKSWGQIIKGTMFRMALIAFPQVTLLCIWEFTQVDSPACVVDAVVILLLVVGLMVYGTTRVVFRGLQSTRIYKNPAFLLYGDSTFLNKYGFLYVQFKATHYWWLVPLLSYSFLRSLFVAVLQNQGKVQSMLVFVIELFYFVALCWIRPYMDKRTNIFNIAIHFINLWNSLFFVFFSNLFGQPEVVSSVMGVVLFVVNAVMALFLLVFTIVSCTLAVIHKNPDARYQPMKDDRVSFIPKVGGDLMDDEKDTELNALSRAVMDTNETEDQRMQRNNVFQLGSNSDSSNKRLLMDENEDYELESNSLWSKTEFPAQEQQQHLKSPFADSNNAESSSGSNSNNAESSSGSNSYFAAQQPMSSLQTNSHTTRMHTNSNPYANYR